MEDGNHIIGSYGLFRIGENECELRKMYLAADHRRKGFGKLLLESALRRAEELRFSSITLETASVLKEAIALYKKYGFKPYTPSHLSARCDQAYRKKLGMPNQTVHTNGSPGESLKKVNHD